MASLPWWGDEGEEPPEQHEPGDGCVDRSSCLLHQKLQLLDLCVRERRKQEEAQRRKEAEARRRRLSLGLGAEQEPGQEQEQAAPPLSSSFATPPQSLGRLTSGRPGQGAGQGQGEDEEPEPEFFDTRESSTLAPPDEAAVAVAAAATTTTTPPSAPARVPRSPSPLPSPSPTPPPTEREGALELVVVDELEPEDEVAPGASTAVDAEAGAIAGAPAAATSVSPSPNLLWMLAGGDAVVMRPQLQRRCPLTEDGARQRQQLLQQAWAAGETAGGSGSAAVAVAQLAMPELLSDMEAFKAANPGCVLADFARWRCPGDWRPWTGQATATRQAMAEDEKGEDEEEEEEEPAATRLAWRGQGRVDPCFFKREEVGALGPAAVRALWLRARPVPAARQRPLLAAAREGEAVLHYLETISPAHVLCQTLAAAFHAAYFCLAQAQTPAAALPGTQAALRALSGLLDEALGRLHEEQLAAETVLGAGPGAGAGAGGSQGQGQAAMATAAAATQAVSQGCLAACEGVCAAVAALEDRLRRGTSLLHKLPNQERLAEALLPLLPSSSASAASAAAVTTASVPLVDEDERAAVLRLFTGGVGPGLVGSGQPSTTAALLSSSDSDEEEEEVEDGKGGKGKGVDGARGSLPGRRKGAKAKKGKEKGKGTAEEEEEGDEDELLHAYEEVMARRRAAAEKASSKGTEQADTGANDAASSSTAMVGDKEEGRGEDSTPSPSSSSASGLDSAPATEASSPPPPPVLPPPDTRTYVLRCQAPQPFFHPAFSAFAAAASPVVTSRLHATVDRHDDSIRLALALAESEL